MPTPRCLAFLILLLPTLLVAKPLTVSSPDKHLRLTVATDANDHLVFGVTLDDRVVVEPSPLGIIVDGQDLGAAARLGKARLSTTKETYPIFGGHSQALNHSRDALVPVTSGTGTGIAWMLEARVFDDGVALRYRVPGAPDVERKIKGETTTWHLPAGGTIWYQDNTHRDYESPIRRCAVNELAAQLKPGVALMTTSLVRLPGPPVYVMMTEANLTRYSDLALAPDPAAPGAFSALFHNSPDGWSQAGEIVSPWRVTLVAADLGTLVNTDLIRNVCPPPTPALAQADWIRPGRATWSWMISRRPKLPEQKMWIDWTRQLGFEDYIIDDGWNRWKQEGKDAWACMDEVVAYATSQDVRIWAWTDSKELLTTEARAAYFKRARQAGLVGLKIDFMKPADPWWVQWYDDTIRELAGEKLLVDFHGALKPTGRDRTWPNDLTREAVQGREARKRPGLHDTALPFTRFVQGPADYTPTDFRAEELKGNSYAHELAQAIVYTSPLFVYSGSPADYLASDAVDFIKAIPPVWDETVVLPGSEVGETAAFARRRGREWFIGVVNGSTARTLEIALGFLGKGTFNLEQFADVPEQNAAWQHSRNTVKKGDKIMAPLRLDGGYIARLVPVK